MSFLGICLWAIQIGEFVHTAVQNFGFVTIEGFAFGKQPAELFTCIDELLYFFLDWQDAFLPVKGTRGEIISMRLKSGWPGLVC